MWTRLKSNGCKIVISVNQIVNYQITIVATVVKKAEIYFAVIDVRRHFIYSASKFELFL